MKKLRIFLKCWLVDFVFFVRLLGGHILSRYFSPRFAKFEVVKSFFVGKLYQQRGRYSRLIANGVMVTVMMLGVTVGPSLVVNDTQAQAMLSSGLRNRIAFAADVTPTAGAGQVLGLSTETQVEVDTMTQVSDKPRAEVVEYKVEEGETLAGISKKFGVDVDSIKWLNKGVQEKKIKAGTVLKVPPVTGVVHTVKSGETIYSLAKKYNVSAQSIVDFPFNEFTNDETFALAIGQTLVVPDGEMPNEPVVSPRNLAQQLTPNAGAVSATGSWIWPAAGRITQGFRPWHKAIDIAKKDGGPILAADSGVVVIAGWPDNSGYGNRIVIDHGNGYRTLYAHLSKFSVVVGQTVKRGDIIGQMGSTGRSTGTHVHFEIRQAAGNSDPLAYLR